MSTKVMGGKVEREIKSKPYRRAPFPNFPSSQFCDIARHWKYDGAAPMMDILSANLNPAVRPPPSELQAVKFLLGLSLFKTFRKMHRHSAFYRPNNTLRNSEHFQLLLKTVVAQWRSPGLANFFDK